MNFNLSGKTALVAASSQGLGRAIAEELLKEGANVMICGRDEEKLSGVQEELKSIGKGQVNYFKVDLTNNEEIVTLVDHTVKKYGGIDILVNNAGGPPAGSFDTITDEMWQNAFELNLLSFIRLIRESLPYLRKQGGKIINVASTSIKEPIPGLILSNTFRTGIAGLSKTLAGELAKDGILINTVAPGRISTDRTKHLDSVRAKAQGITVEEAEKNSKANIPLKRYGTPEEFAKVVTFLASDANSYMTGSSFLVDGGMIKSL
ncbi:SDR family oxidoreductase [Bacillus dakarensis]|uniref:SDR family oxidoreductase n=1 Tax=Robertmurraya dakarensis TaxID=1926278 RepID=UPI0009822010|nr:SDR family oxidoreductase [Bacillus dakarensis]